MDAKVKLLTLLIITISSCSPYKIILNNSVLPLVYFEQKIKRLEKALTKEGDETKRTNKKINKDNKDQKDVFKKLFESTRKIENANSSLAFLKSKEDKLFSL